MLLLVLGLALWLPGWGVCEEADTHEDHDCATGAHGEHDPDADAHAGHNHDADPHASHDHDAEMQHAHDHKADAHPGHDHGHREIVELPAGAAGLAGLTLETARPRPLGRTIEMPGEIRLNSDRLVHVTPRFPGVAREIRGRLGQSVAAGDVLAVIESNESLSSYEVKAPISGRIIEKHLGTGEFVSEDHEMFVVADLSTVWADLQVYPKDISFVSPGARVEIFEVGTDLSRTATISYVAPLYSEATRSALARAVLENDDGWRPGTFITGTIHAEAPAPRLTVSADAVQILGEERVVFVPTGDRDRFEAVPVELGLKGDRYVEVVTGLEPGDSYVASGAYELKARLVTQDLGAHAGHGH
jgi:cobalt-zinc-cadmium efflux system membrane fusion protein